MTPAFPILPSPPPTTPEPVPGDATVTSIEEAATTLTRASWQRGVPLNRAALCWLLSTGGSAAPGPPAQPGAPGGDAAEMRGRS